MFDGAFRATRKVNMSGGRRPSFASSSSSSASSKEQIVLQAKRAREERYEQRRRATACTRIQALCRRLAVAARARTAVFCALEAELTQLVTSTDIRATAMPAHTLSGFLRQFWFAFGRDLLKNLEGGGGGGSDQWVGMTGVSRQRVLNVQNYLVFMLLVSCLRAQTPETNFLAAPKDAAWIYQVCKCSGAWEAVVLEETDGMCIGDAAAGGIAAHGDAHALRDSAGEGNEPVPAAARHVLEL